MPMASGRPGIFVRGAGASTRSQGHDPPPDRADDRALQARGITTPPFPFRCRRDGVETGCQTRDLRSDGQVIR